MKSLPLFLCLSVIVISGVRPAPAAGEPAKEYILTNKSAYQPSDEARNPFWPIGFKPSATLPDTPQAPQPEALPEVHPENFVVTTISLERDAPLAVINGRTHGIGDRLPVDTSGREFVVVKKIMDGAVVLDFHGQLIRCVAGRRGPGK